MTASTIPAAPGIGRRELLSHRQDGTNASAKPVTGQAASSSPGKGSVGRASTVDTLTVSQQRTLATTVLTATGCS